LAAPRGEELRPTTGRVREALFSLLGGRIAGAEVVDLCCGAGALGIEALSRGAALVRFVDRSARALALTRENLERCGAAGGSWVIARADAVRWLGRCPAPAPGRPLVILADPPYAGELAARLLRAVVVLPPAVPVSVLGLEHAPEAALPLAAAAGFAVRQRRYGGTVLTILEASP
jgi:16S rRNA (guanine(966)-N(2))-methyltransferase RsmD